MQNRPDAESCPGGDTVQMHRTAEALRRAGHSVRISFELHPDLTGIDLVYLFNLTRPHETFQQAENARRAGAAYVLSPVYWDLESAVPWRAYEFPRNWYRRVFPRRVRERARLLACAEERGDPTYLQAEILRGARMAFPNSQAELMHLREQFASALGEAMPDMTVVLNGIDPPSHDVTGDESVRGAFVCAGAIGPRKNQLALVRAFRRLPDERLVVIGRASPGSGRYLRAVRRAAGPNASFRDAVPHAKMPSIWHTAKACAQPSWIETPGLSAMEAMAAGAAVVAADVGPVREYFGDASYYCDPGDEASIADACRRAAGSVRTDGSGFAARHAWAVVLEPLMKAIEQIEGSLRRA